MYISKIGVVFHEIYAKNRATCTCSISQTVQECPDLQPEGLVASVAQLGLCTCKFYSPKSILLELLLLLSNFHVLVVRFTRLEIGGFQFESECQLFSFLFLFFSFFFRYHSHVVFENIGPSKKKPGSYNN